MIDYHTPKALPGDWVVVTFACVNYKGRIVSCKLVRGNQFLYNIQYVDDTGTFKYDDFYSDEFDVVQASKT